MDQQGDSHNVVEQLFVAAAAAAVADDDDGLADLSHHVETRPPATTMNLEASSLVNGSSSSFNNANLNNNNDSTALSRNNSNSTKLQPPLLMDSIQWSSLVADALKPPVAPALLVKTTSLLLQHRLFDSQERPVFDSFVKGLYSLSVFFQTLCANSQNATVADPSTSQQ